MNYQRLSSRWCWNLTCFSRRNETDPSREGLWPEETNRETTFSQGRCKFTNYQHRNHTLLCIIDAEEERDVTIIDIPNALMRIQVEDKEDMAIIKIHGVLVDILVQIAPDVYKSYIMTDKKGMK
jgi:hypothetical protein